MSSALHCHFCHHHPKKTRFKVIVHGAVTELCTEGVVEEEITEQMATTRIP
jgi:hypothetical protein